MKEFLRKDLLTFKPYDVEDCSYKYKMDANESPFSLPYIVKEEFSKWFESGNLNIYPDTNCSRLKNIIAQKYNLKSENILCGVGSDQIIEFISKAFLEKNDYVLVPTPSFSMYGITAKLNHGKVKEIPLIKTINNFIYPIDDFINAEKILSSKIIYICTPNNPTGSIIEIEQIEELLKNVKCPVVVDEAYGEFCDESIYPFIEKYKNLIVLRTFSKAYGIAGARIGYALAQSETIQCVNIVCPPYHLNSMSQVLAASLLESEEQVKERALLLKDERERIYKIMKDLDFVKTFVSGANFIYFESGINIAEKMKKNGILIRDFGKQENDGVYAARASVSTKDANDAFISVLEDLKNEGM